MRVGNLRQMRKYSTSVRKSFAEEGIGPGRDVPLPGLDGVESRLAVPAIALGELVGVLVVESDRAVAFNHDDESLLSVVASFLASAIEIDRARERESPEAAPAVAAGAVAADAGVRRGCGTSRSTAASSSTATTSSAASRDASSGRCSSSTSPTDASTSRTRRSASTRARASRLPRQPRHAPHPPEAQARRARRVDPPREDRPRPLSAARRRRRPPRICLTPRSVLSRVSLRI